MPIEIEYTDLELESWRDGAACIDRDDIGFFPTPEDVGAINRAKAVCASCPVADVCLGFAIETNQPDGIWGGMTTRERQKIRRRWLEEFRRAS